MHLSDIVRKNSLSFQYSTIPLGLSNLVRVHYILEDVFRKGSFLFLENTPGLSFKRGEEKVAHERKKEYFDAVLFSVSF